MSLSGAQAGALSRAEAVLAGLDEEQRAAAQAVSGPGLHPRRRRHRQDPHDHPPHRLRRAHRRLRPRAGARGDLHRPGGGRAARPAGRPRRRRGAGAHLPRGGHAPAALLRPAGARRPDAGAGREQAAAGGDGGLRARGCPPTGPACATSPARSSGPRPPWPRRRTTRRGPRRPAGSRRSRRPRSPRSTPATSRPSSATARSTSRTCCWSPPTRSRSTADVAREVRGQYRHFVVDEYQDVNPLQQRLLDAWLGGRAEVCVVGDPNQTIYSFTGADPDYLLGFADRYPDAAVVKLERDYRSTPQVVGAGQPADRPGAAAQGPAGAAAAGSARRRPRAARSSSTPTSRPRRPPSRRAAGR